MRFPTPAPERRGCLSTQDETMKRLIQSIAGLFLAISLVGCCYSPGYVDSCNGVAYGGGYEPCNIPDPFAGLFGCGGWGGCGTASCTPACGTAPCGVTTCANGYVGTTVSPVVGSYSSGVISAPVIGSYSPTIVPTVPAGIFEQVTPAATAVPLPSTPHQTGSIIYQTHPSNGQLAPPTQDARNQPWVPARL